MENLKDLTSLEIQSIQGGITQQEVGEAAGEVLGFVIAYSFVGVGVFVALGAKSLLT